MERDSKPPAGLRGVHVRFRNEGVKIPHAAQSVLNLDFAQRLVRVRADLLEQLALLGYDLFEGLFEIGLGCRGMSAALGENLGGV